MPHGRTFKLLRNHHDCCWNLWQPATIRPRMYVGINWLLPQWSADSSAALSVANLYGIDDEPHGLYSRHCSYLNFQSSQKEMYVHLDQLSLTPAKSIYCSLIGLGRNNSLKLPISGFQPAFHYNRIYKKCLSASYCCLKCLLIVLQVAW